MKLTLFVRHTAVGLLLGAFAARFLPAAEDAAGVTVVVVDPAVSEVSPGAPARIQIGRAHV